MLIITLSLIIVFTIVILWTIRAAPKNQVFGDPLLDEMELPNNKDTVLFVGDNNIRGEFAASFIENLMKNKNIYSYQFYNGGCHFETLSTLLEKVPLITRYNFKFIFIMVGTFDILAGQGGPLQLFQSLVKGQRGYIDEKSFTSEYHTLINELKKNSKSEIVLMTLPPIGESVDGWGQEKSIYFSNLIRQVAHHYKCGLIDFNKSIQQKYFAEGDMARIPRDYDGGWLFCETHFRHFFLWERVAKTRRRSGMRWTTDLVHINTRSAELLSKMIAQYLITRNKPIA